MMNNQHLRSASENITGVVNLLAILADPKGIKKIIAELEAARDAATEGLATEEARLTTLAANLDALQTAFEKDKAFLAKKGKEQDEGAAALAEQEKKLAALSAELNAREAKIKAQSEALDAERASHSTDNAARAAQIIKRDKEVTAREDEHVARQAALQEELKRLEDVTAKLVAGKARLKSAEAAAENKHKEYEVKLANLRKHLE